jgi:hypothetical protein
MARHRARRLALALAITVGLGGFASGCPTDPEVARTPTPSPPAAETAEFRAKAHADAYARLVPLARRAFELADPISDAVLADVPLRPRPFSVGGRAALRKAVDAAWIEAAEIRAEFLPPETALLLRVIRFGLSRLRDEQQRRPSTRTDPAIGPRATAALVDEVTWRGPACAGCDDALGAAGPELDAALADLGATTPARARAAATQCDALRAEVTAWRRAHTDPERLAGALALEAALDRARDRLLAVAGALDRATVIASPPEGLRAARAPTDALRLPDRLGATELRRVLDVHESEARDASALFAELLGAAAQLAGLPDPGPIDAAAVKPIDEARCVAAWAPLATYAKTMPVLVAAFDCARDRLRLPAAADDHDLVRALVVAGIVEPTRRATRAHTEPVLARVAGDIAPAAHRHALSLAVLSGAKQTEARARAGKAARADVCTALVALWIHGEQGDDAALREQLAGPCRGVEIGPRIDAVLARPEASLAGLGLVMLAMGPADAVALERAWWLPLGLVIPAMRPEGPQPGAPVEVRTEELTPGAPP